jgi:uncharacterized protein (DUF2062 family)
VNENKKHHRRTRWGKRFLKFLPSKAHLEKYPIIGRYAASLRTKAFLWSFRRSEVFSAFLVGWVITLTPFYGTHTILSLLAAFLFRANLLVILALQLVSNPLAEPFIWIITHKIGKFVIHQLANGDALVASAINGPGGALAGLPRWIATATLGSILLGFACAVISCCAYEIFARYKKYPN